MKAVVFDAMGVLYTKSDDITDLLYPFLKTHGSTIDYEKLLELYKPLSKGFMKASEFWKAAGIEPLLEDEYIKTFSLTDSITETLKRLRNDGFLLYCLSNDVSEWSKKLRIRFGLEDYIKDFVISGDVGFRKPKREIFDILIKKTNISPTEMIFIDDRIKNLDMAKAIGFNTILYTEHLYTETDQHIAAGNYLELYRIITKMYS
jgi:HAD superfamily hydrolase (TIGR01509 family)